MRKKRPTLVEVSPFEQFDASPLIDVGFLLLIFFLVTSSLRKSETELETLLAGEPPDTSTPIDTLTVDIEAKADGLIRFNGVAVASDLAQRSLPVLIGELKRAKALSKAAQTPLMANIKIDDGASQQRFADVLNALTAAGVENVALDGGL